jgi:penicillin-binding protein 1A
MRTYVRKTLALGCVSAALTLALATAMVGGYYFVEPGLPDAEELRDVPLQVPLTVYSRDGRLMAQLGEKRRTPVAFDDIPLVMVQAILAAEDDRFFDHPGFDYQGLLRAAINYLTTGSRAQGGSTITQQLARDYFLTRTRKFVRKFKEIIIATRIETEFSKEEILELYLNKIFLGQRAYGVVAAAQVYFGKELADLTVAEAAVIAGIPKGPSVLNPVSNREGSLGRRKYVLRRMNELGFIDPEEYGAASMEPLIARRHGPQVQLQAPYVAELVRREMLERFGDDAYTQGYRVTTSIDSRLQRSANAAVRRGLLEYDRRHGYRGPTDSLDPMVLELPEGGTTSQVDEIAARDSHLEELLGDYQRVGDLVPAVVLSVDRELADVYVAGAGPAQLTFESMEWAKPALGGGYFGKPPKGVDEVLQPGAVIQVAQASSGAAWQLAQTPEAQAAFVAMDPQDGAVAALVGGFDYFASKYNRATQARRQPGSAFKPFVYSAALDNGFTPATLIADSPVVFDSKELESVWKPQNYNRSFGGEMMLREALVKSKNLVSVRVILKVGPGVAARHIRKFGFDDAALPVNPGLALGAGNLTPVDLARGYSVFANRGFRVSDYLIQRIENVAGEVLFEAEPIRVCAECELALAEAAESEPVLISDPMDLYPPRKIAPRVIDPTNAYLMNDMMLNVVRRGTGIGAFRALGRLDIGGKTGTSNDQRDAWFAGFNADLVGISWVGFDQERPLGVGEQGGRTALPAWTHFMAEALAGVAEKPNVRPPGLVDVRINPDNGLVTSARNSRGQFVTFRIGEVPPREEQQDTDPYGNLPQLPVEATDPSLPEGLVMGPQAADEESERLF